MVLRPKRLPPAYACMVLRPSNGVLGSTYIQYEINV